jgi:polysaccharide biosynthesis/export protein
MAVSLSGCGASLTEGSAGGMTLGQADGKTATTQEAMVGAVLDKPTSDKVVAEATHKLVGASATVLASPSSGSSTVEYKAAPKVTAPAKAVEAFTASATPGNTAYKVGALDVLDVSVFKAPELSKSVQVADSGTINLPLIEDVQAVGRTAQEIERDIAAKLGAKYLQKPQVTVYIREYNSQRITVEGAVKKPGVFPARGGNTLLQYIAMAEGLDPNSDSTVLVFRTTAEGARSAAKFDVSEIRAGAAKDPSLQSGDVVVVGTSVMKEGFNTFIKLLPLASVFALL